MAASLEAIRSELTRVVATAAPGLTTANELCAACVGLFGMDGAAVSMVYQGASQGTYGSSSATSRRLDEYQFTFGEGPCLDATASQAAVLVPDLDTAVAYRWPVFAEAVLAEGIRGVFALPIMITSECVGALDLFRARPGPLDKDQLAGALLAAELAAAPLLDLIASATVGDLDGHPRGNLPDDNPHDDPNDDLVQLDRVEVYQATGMLMAQLQVDPTEALVRLRAHAIATGQTATQVALAIIERTLVLDRDHPHHSRETGRETGRHQDQTQDQDYDDGPGRSHP